MCVEKEFNRLNAKRREFANATIAAIKYSIIKTHKGIIVFYFVRDRASLLSYSSINFHIYYLFIHCHIPQRLQVKTGVSDDTPSEPTPILEKREPSQNENDNTFLHLLHYLLLKS